MTVPLSNYTENYLTNGSAVNFPYTWKINDTSELLVTKTLISTGASVTASEGAGNDYTVTGAGSESGGNVVWNSTLASGYRITITPNMELVQLTDFENQGGFYADTHEDEIDRSRMIDRMLQEQIDRCFKVPIGSSIDPDSVGEDIADEYSLVAYVAEDLLSSYNSLAAAVISIGATDKQLIIDQDDTLTGDLTVPANIHLRFVQGNVINTGSYTLTLNGSVEAGAFQIFNTSSGSGTVLMPKARWALVQWWGAVCDGSTDDSQAFADANAAGRYLTIPAGTYIVTQQAYDSPIGLIATSPDAKLKNSTNDERTIYISDDGSDRNERCVVDGLQVEDDGTDSNDDWAAIYLDGSDNSRICNNTVVDSHTGISSQYGALTLGPYTGNPATENQPERQSRGNSIMFNNVQAGFFAYEIFSALRHRIVGNNAYNDTTQGTSHAYRMTGYPGMPCSYNSLAANVGDNYANGLSVQTVVRYNSINGLVVSNLSDQALQLNPNTTYASSITGYNYYQLVAHDVDYGIYADKPSYSYFNLIAHEVDTTGVHFENDNASSYGDSEHNIVDAIVHDAPKACRIENNNNIIRINSADLTDRAVDIIGNNNIVDIVVDGVTNAGSQFSVLIQGNNNIVRCNAANNATGTSADISVSGDNNDVTVNTDVGVTTSGDNNVVRGNLGALVPGGSNNRFSGTASSVTRGGTNTDYSGLVGGSKAAFVSDTTDGSGEITITTAVPSGLDVHAVTAQFISSTDNKFIVVKSATVASTTLTIVLRVVNADGTAFASSAVSIYYRHQAI